jgi:branched-chain amino acid transport system permease protein
MYYRQLVILIGINAFLALASYVPFSSGLLVVCLGTFMSAGAIVAAFAHSTLGLPLPVAVMLGAFGGGVAGACVGVACRQLGGFSFAMATLGIGELARIGVTNVEALGGALGYRNVRMMTSLVDLGFFLGILLGFFCLFEASALRKAFAVVREDQTLASTLGIDIARHRIAATTAAGFLAGIGGGFYVHAVGVLEPRMFGFENSILILAYAIVGGARNFGGAFLAAIILTTVPEVLRFSMDLRMILYGVSLVLVVVLRPEGLLGTKATSAGGRLSKAFGRI